MWKTIVVLVYLLVLSIYDLRERKVPLMLLAVGGAVTILGGIYNGVMGSVSCIQLLLGVLPGMFLLIVAWATKKAGYADGIVLMLLGAVEGYRRGILLLCFSLLLLSFVVILLLFLRKVGRYTQMPYIPFLAGTYFLTQFM